MFEKSVAFRKLYGLLLGRPMNFSFIDENVAGSARPFSKREIDWLRKKGIGAILSLTENPIKSEWLDGLAYKNVQMKDHSVPKLSDVRESVDYLISQNKLGRGVVVHCMAGKGRTGTVLAAYLCEKYGLDPKEAISGLRAKRPGSVERRQASVVEEFALNLSRKDPSESSK